MKNKPSSPRNKYAKPLKFNLGSIFSEKPIVKNGYLVALLVFIGLVVAFNLAGSYDNSVGNQVTGMAIGDSLDKITELLSTFTNFIFGGILEGTVLGAFLLHNDVIIRLLIFVALFTIISLFRMPKTISVIVAFLPAVFVPQEVIESIFSSGGLFSGGLGLIIWAAFIFLPLFGLFKWLKHTQSKLTSLFLAVMLLGWLFVMTSVNDNIYVTPYFTDLWDLLIGFGSLVCFVGFFWGIWKGFQFKFKIKDDYKSVDDFIKRGGVMGDWERTKKHLGGLWGGIKGGPPTGDQREALVKLEKLANEYKKKIRDRNVGVSEQTQIEERFVQEAKKLGVGRSQARKIFWKK